LQRMSKVITVRLRVKSVDLTMSVQSPLSPRRVTIDTANVKPHLTLRRQVCRTRTTHQRGDPCEGKRLTERLLVLGYFFGEQRQQPFVPIVVPVRITFALGYQPPVMLDISVVDETRHGDLHGYVGEGGARGPPELDYLPFQTQCNTRRRAAN